MSPSDTSSCRPSAARAEASAPFHVKRPRKRAFVVLGPGESVSHEALGSGRRLDRTGDGVAPLGPGARVEAAAAEARVLDDEQVVAGGDARAAVGDDRRDAVDADRGATLAQL